MAGTSPCFKGNFSQTSGWGKVKPRWEIPGKPKNKGCPKLSRNQTLHPGSCTAGGFPTLLSAARSSPSQVLHNLSRPQFGPSRCSQPPQPPLGVHSPGPAQLSRRTWGEASAPRGGSPLLELAQAHPSSSDAPVEQLIPLLLQGRAGALLQQPWGLPGWIPPWSR